MKRWLLAGLIFCLGVGVGGVGGWRLAQARSADNVPRGLQPGQRPPAFSVADLNGDVHTLEDYKGSVLVLHFWATWCPYCRSEIPELRTLNDEWAWKGVSVLSVSIDDNIPLLHQFVQQVRLPYPVIADSDPPKFLGERYDTSTIPVTYIIGRDGLVVLRLSGSSDILSAVQLALEEDGETSPTSS